MTRLPSISVVTPLWNEEESIDSLCLALNNLFQSDKTVAWEWVAVDDGSSDQTCSRVAEAMSRSGVGKLIKLSRNFGQQAAYKAGLEHASGDAIVFLDADLQDPPEKIGEMIGKWKDGAKLVVGCRRSRPEKGARGVLFKLFHELFYRLTSGAMPKNSGTFGLMDRVIVEQLKVMPELNLFLPALRSWVGYRQETVWYDRKERLGQPKQTYRKLFNYAWDGITSFSEVPLKFISWLGCIVCILGFGYALLLISIKLMQYLGCFERLQVPGFTTLAVAILCLGGVQLLSLGIIGEYLARIYREVKQRPHYVVEIVKQFGTSDQSV